MDKKLVRQWIKALRSGKFEQGKEALENFKVDDSGKLTGERSYCCLGVACKLLAKEKKKSIYEIAGGTGSIDKGALLIRLGLDLRMQDNLIDMNDVFGKSFKEIADFIEKNILNKKAA